MVSDGPALRSRGYYAVSASGGCWRFDGVRDSLGNGGVAERERAMAGDRVENWRLIVEAAHALTTAGQSPFTRASVYEWIRQRYPRSEHDRPSLAPVFQGMTGNAPGGLASSAGTPLARIGRGQYVLASAVTAPRGGSMASSLRAFGGMRQGKYALISPLVRPSRYPSTLSRHCQILKPWSSQPMPGQVFISHSEMNGLT
jgi:hypothetical protein